MSWSNYIIIFNYFILTTIFFCFQLFKGIVDFRGFWTDAFLQKKVNDLTHLALLGYLDPSDLEEFDHHPGVVCIYIL